MEPPVQQGNTASGPDLVNASCSAYIRIISIFHLMSWCAEQISANNHADTHHWKDIVSAFSWRYGVVWVGISANRSGILGQGETNYTFPGIKST
jgi:hypothetical protein